MTLSIHLYRRMMRKGRVIALLALSSIPGLVYWLSAFDADATEKEALYPEIITTSGFSFAIAALIITVATLREERDSGTLPYIYMRPISRLSIAWSSMVAAVAAAGTLAIGGWASTVIAVAAVGADTSMTFPGLTLFLTAAVGYSALFVPLGYLVPRSTLIGLGYIVIVESIIGVAIEGVAQLSIWRISASIYADLAPIFGGEAQELLGPVTPGVGGGLIKLGSTLVVGMSVLVWALRRRDAL